MRRGMAASGAALILISLSERPISAGSAPLLMLPAPHHGEGAADFSVCDNSPFVRRVADALRRPIHVRERRGLQCRAEETEQAREPGSGDVWVAFMRP
jgi:hypothetical protein